MRDQVLEHRFVESFPETLEAGVLYISLEYGSAAHSCCCGCGEEVVTPLTPTDWSIIYDGEAVTLHPSVGSWTLPCRSHYVIRRNRVIEAPPWSDSEIEAERRRDRRAKAAHFGVDAPAGSADAVRSAAEAEDLRPESGWKDRLFGWLWRPKS
ncbi:DUF6527 family protein [Sphingobium xenophagum]|jgi:hypothetical protein|uniref:DUF6527 family protein n=1 Tax=Sphingobium xenophagum TaxID=121428 RepID=UPI0024202976|nr:DUF6527 family protein [Sphingobium xenophagum]